MFCKNEFAYYYQESSCQIFDTILNVIIAMEQTLNLKSREEEVNEYITDKDQRKRGLS